MLEEEYAQVRSELINGVIKSPERVKLLLTEYDNYRGVLDIIVNPKKYGPDGHDGGSCGPYHRHPIPWAVARDMASGKITDIKEYLKTL